MMKLSLVAALCGFAGALKASPKNYNSDVDDVRAMMEGVRAQTEGHPTLAADGKAIKEKSHPAKKADEEQFPGLADELMSKADRIQQEIDGTAKKSESKLTALAVKDSVSAHDRAARFFATHGMKSVGQMLGDMLSADAEKKALAEEASVQKRLRASMATAGATAPPLFEKTAPAKAAVTADAELDALASDDDEDEAEKKRWAAVDALKHRAHHFH
eukprot:TRINITY_DN81478_c0_g1_i1.p2 TRINITY_DN81478_c0_g1~~TRINITY_DN81478_c0_g1_i1.p2  ORF type:complete len:216 (-),score=79.05 TRINITY_DN81478_c0_g1_i1:54-701(-)